MDALLQNVRDAAVSDEIDLKTDKARKKKLAEIVEWVAGTGSKHGVTCGEHGCDCMRDIVHFAQKALEQST